MKYKNSLSVGELPVFTPQISVYTTSIRGSLIGILTNAPNGSAPYTYGSFSISALANSVSLGSGYLAADLQLNADHSHSVVSNSIGGNQFHNNIPPFCSAYIWIRTS